jgi:hypothetical protein
MPNLRVGNTYEDTFDKLIERYIMLAHAHSCAMSDCGKSHWDTTLPYSCLYAVLTGTFIRAIEKHLYSPL